MDVPPARSEAATAWKRWILGPTPSDRVFLFEELAALVTAGFGIRQAVDDLLRRSSGRRRRALTRVADALAHDVPPGRALALLPECFSPAEAALVATGEHTGRYDVACRAAAAEIERARQALTKVVRAVAYPLFLVHFAIFVPACSVIRMNSGASAARLFVWVAFLGLWALILGGWTLHVARRGSRAWSRAVARAPLAGTVAVSGALSRACRVAGALHEAGVGVADTLDAAAVASQNGWIADDLRAAADRVRAGATTAEALAGVGSLGTAARSLIETGERSGSLGAAFERIAGLEDERFGVALRRLAIGLGAALMATVGLAVFWMMASVLGRAYGGF